MGQDFASRRFADGFIGNPLPWCRAPEIRCPSRGQRPPLERRGFIAAVGQSAAKTAPGKARVEAGLGTRRGQQRRMVRFSRALWKVFSGTPREIVAWTPVRLHARGQSDAPPARDAEAALASCSGRRGGVRADVCTANGSARGSGPRGFPTRRNGWPGCATRANAPRENPGRSHMRASRTRTRDHYSGQSARCCSALSSLRTRWPPDASEGRATAA